MSISEPHARQALQTLLNDFQRLTPDERKQMSEASVVRQFVDRLLEEVLGWPIKDPARYKYELTTQVGRPDLTLIPERGGTIFIEAKRFGVIKELEQARYTIAGTITPGQMALPGMAVDRTPEEQQAINYAFANGGTWAILTNFEKLRLFNARRDWLVLSFESPGAYLHDFDLLWQLAYPNVLNGSLDALSNQRHTEEVDTTYLVFINEWRQRLAQDVVQGQNPWAFDPDGSINLPLLRAVVQRFLDRLVVIRFAEDHLVIPPGTLRQLYEYRQNNLYAPSADRLLDEFFRRFDENHNSALFAPGVVDSAMFSDEVLLPLIGKLYEARYRSMPADIIGNTYEQYLGKTLVQRNGSIDTADNLETRKKQGSYYTPQVIVRYIVDNSLGRYLYGTENGKPDGNPVEQRKTSQDIRDLRVLDSACGSGSFLIYAYFVLAEFYESEMGRLEQEAEERRRQLAAEGMTSPLDLQIQLTPYTAEIERIRDYPRLILETHLYGVDLDPQAAEIAVVNLMMRAMERRHREKRLPLILNQNVKVGNSLIGVRPDDPRMAQYADGLGELIRLRHLLTTDPDRFSAEQRDQMRIKKVAALTAGVQDETIRAALTEYYKTHEVLEEKDTYPTYTGLREKTEALADALNADLAAHFGDLSRVRPFHWGGEFPEAFYDEHGQPLENPGFTVIIGNPPWEIVMPDEREVYAQFDPLIESRLQGRAAEARIFELDAENPRRRIEFEAQKTHVEQSAAYYHSSDDYQYQGTGHVATHKLFLERMYRLLQTQGRIGYVLPAGIYRDKGTKELREMLLNEGNIQYIFSFSNERGFFAGVHHDFRFSVLGTQKGVLGDGFWATFRFNPRIAVEPDYLPDFLANRDNLIYVRREALERFSPDSFTLMEFQTRGDYDIAEKIYGVWPLVKDETDNIWPIRITQEFNMTTDSKLFNQREKGLPLYEGKMIHQYDSFFAPPRYWIDEYLGAESLARSQAASWFKTYRFAFRDVSNATNERTFISTILPRNTFTGHTLWVGRTPNFKMLLFCTALVNSFCLDWIIRFKVDKHVTLFIVKQLPIPRLTLGNPYFDATVPRAARLTCTRAEFADLWQEVIGEPWDESKGATDPAERQRLRDEIDAIVAHLYGLSRDDFDHILGTFPLVFPDTDEGQAKRAALLATYDEWAGQL